MELTDWRGNTYREGSHVIYAAMSGHSVELQEATILEIYTSYKDPASYGWKKLKEGQEVPFKRVWDHGIQEYVDSTERVDTQVRAKLQPNGRGSRDFHMRQDREYYHENSNTGEKMESKALYKLYYPRVNSRHGYPDYEQIHKLMSEEGWEMKSTEVQPRPVTLTVLDNITVV